MKIEVSKPVLTKTTSCRNKFSCLSSARSQVCRVRHLMKDSLIIECAGDCPCTYQFSFGTWSICSCPTRKEIYTRYAV